MKKAFPYLCLLTFCCCPPQLMAQEDTSHLYVYLKDGKVDAYPQEVMKSKEQTEQELRIVLKNDSLIAYPLSEVDSLGRAPVDFPVFTSFKFNNKYNENIYTDVYATIGADSVKASVGAIGKWLTPSFKLSAEGALVYVDGDLQQSKVSRQHFDEPVAYTVTSPNYRVLHYEKVKDEEWSEGKPGEAMYEEVPLTVDMLSTNAPSNFPNREGLDKLLDGDVSTFFHSTWGSGAHEKLPLDQDPYIEVALDQAMDEFVFAYTTRPDNDIRNPKDFLVQGSNDRQQWTDIRELTDDDGMPMVGAAATYVSPNIVCDRPYSYLRFVMTDSQYKNYLALSEFSLRKYLGESGATDPELIAPAVYAYKWHPLGRDYVVDVDWLTDAADARVPRIDIHLLRGKKVEHINKQNYVYGRVAFDGGNVFPDLKVDTVMVKGRGNSTWHDYDRKNFKNPYRLKFLDAVKPFGMTKGKNWVLLANAALRGSMLTNAVGMKVARMVGTAGANDVIPVDLYINGEYRGNYNLTQHVGLHCNSVDIDETNAVLLELDTNGGDDDPVFYNYSYGVTTKIKEPDFKDLPEGSVLTLQMVKQAFNDFSMDLVGYAPDLERKYDAEMLSRYFLVNELIQNEELMHPKSCFLYREDLLAMHSKFIFGPVWDLDWAYGFEHGNRHCPANFSYDYFKGIENRGEAGGYFYADLRKREAVKRAYYRVWTDFMEHLEEFEDYIDDYYAYARASLEKNNKEPRWNDGYDYAEVKERFKDWLENRAEFIYSTLDTYDLDEPVAVEKGDVNQDGWITLADAVCIQNYLLERPNADFDRKQADANGDGKITVTDLVWTVAWAMETAPDYARHLQLPTAEARLDAGTFTAALGTTSVMPVAMDLTADGYAATQFDVVVPEGMTLETVDLPDGWTNCEVECAPLNEGRYRVGIYSSTDKGLPLGRGELQLEVRTDRTIEQAARVVSLDGVVLVTAEGEDERLAGKSARFDMEVTGIDQTVGGEAVAGGDALEVEALVDGELAVYTIDGRLYRRCHVVAGKNRIALPAGIYIVNQKKVVVHP